MRRAWFAALNDWPTRLSPRAQLWQERCCSGAAGLVLLFVIVGLFWLGSR